MPLHLVLNGQARGFEGLAADASLASLVAELGLKEDRIALELNGEIVPRSGWPSTRLVDGDRLELVHFVGGGTAAGGDESRLFQANPSSVEFSSLSREMDDSATDDGRGGSGTAMSSAGGLHMLSRGGAGAP